MFAKPQCPFCGSLFESVADVMLHLQESSCEPILLLSKSANEPENRNDLAARESDDSHTSNVEGAG
jgi:hypothetical protein